MSSNEGSVQTPQFQDEPTVSATEVDSANPPRRPRPKAVDVFPAWARFIAGVVLIIVIAAAIFFAGFFVGKQYGGGPGTNYIAPPGGGCISTVCHPAGRYGQQCFQQNVKCPGG
jgi:hypothetical protein